MNMLCRFLVPALLFVASAVPALAQPAPSYAVLSLAGDRITVVAPELETGTRLDPDVRDVVKMPDDGLDIIAVEVAEQALKKVRPGAEVELYVTRDSKIFSALNKDDMAPADVPALLATLQKVLAQSKASHLLLISKHRANVQFKFADYSVQVNRLYGAGFYVDESRRLYSVDNRHVKRGYVGPYASLKILLVDLGQRTVVQEVLAHATEIHSTPDGAPTAWAGMSGQDKFNAVRRVLERAVADGITRAVRQP